MYVLLSGAKKNVGDFLIYERARELIRAYKPNEELLELPRWKSIDPYLDTINQKAKAIVICGGPGYASNFSPRILPFARNLSQVRVPVIPLALGWSGKGDVQSFQFSDESLQAIQEIHSRIAFSSVRDVLTEQILHKAGIKNVVMTGCSAWYNLPLVNRDFTPPEKIQRIVVTSPAKTKNMGITVQLLNLVQQRFPKADIFLVFHRGILPDRFTGLRSGFANSLLAIRAYLRKFHVIDAAYATDNIRFYESCDLHIGFRVHAHVDFLAYRKPSILIQEDGRGLGQSVTLGTEDVAADDPHLLQTISQTLERHLDTRFERFHQTTTLMQQTHTAMRAFVEEL